MPNLDGKPPIIVGFKNMVIDVFSTEESIDLSTKSNLLIEFKGGLDSISLKDN